MDFYHLSYPPIPETTAKTARSLFGQGNIYLTVGDQLDLLLQNLISKERYLLDSRVGETYCLYILISAVQYEEKLTDLRLVKALPGRIDILYALHLPEHYSALNPLTLCEFRQHMLSDTTDLNSFQVLLDRLTGLGMFCSVPAKKVVAIDVVKTLAIGNHVAQVVDAFYGVLEKIAVENPDWLRKVTLPHWYERYNRRNLVVIWPDIEGDWRAMPRDMGADIHYLLDEIVKSPVGKISISPEVLNLKHAWEVLSEVMMNGGMHKPDLHWKHSACLPHHG